MARSEDKGEDMGDKLVANPDFDGPSGNRHCTDVLCSILLIVAWIAMTGLGSYAVSNGDYRIVLYPLDFDGNICGTDFAKDMKEFPYLYYINNYGGGVCVAECPDLTNKVKDNLTDVNSMISYGGLFLTANSEVSETTIKVADYSASEDALLCTAATCIPSADPVASWSSSGVNEGYGYAYYVVDSYPILQRCTLTVAAGKRIDELTQSNATLSSQASDEYTKFFNELYADCFTARNYILGFGFGVALLVSFAYVYLMRLPFLLNTVVWTSIFLTIAMFLGSGYFAYTKANFWEMEDPPTQPDTSVKAARYFSYALFIIGGILVLLMICLRKQIQLAIGCVKEAGKAITRMPLMMAVPVIQATGFIAFMTVLTVYGVYLASLAKIVTQDYPLGLNGLEISVRTWEFDDFTYKSGWYLLFCLFWYVDGRDIFG